MQSEFILEERATYPAAELVTTQEFENMDPLIVETEYHPDEGVESIVESEDGPE